MQTHSSDSNSKKDIEMNENTQENSELSGEEGLTWIQWFCYLPGHEYFVNVPEEYIDDEFNLTGLSSTVPHYNEALDMILDVDPEEDYEVSEQTIGNAAEFLYFMIHQRYILTKQGLAAMFELYRQGRFDFCQRVGCDQMPLIPVGLSDAPGLASVKLFCASCVDIYNPDHAYSRIDGVAWGTTFPHLFFKAFQNSILTPPLRIYEPKIFGFRIHKSAANGSKRGYIREGSEKYILAKISSSKTVQK